ncbi:YfhO family protein [Fluviicola chungangensis]|uniref:YfhO family protein n=1 Tax=Fluviicola chungangensis TaxID=2597671 RepID=A0A556MQ12_9FLAO|nr:YfhO family protein [Fluviicola chungangensis]TSJ42000.1 YfhO family protein [Fluviicola chungangensis]
MDIKGFFQKNWMYLAIIGGMFIVIAMFFKPQFEGYGVKQHDIKEWKGMSNETDLFREESGKEPLWTSSAFGGMPAEQISLIYPGNWFKTILGQYFKILPNPVGTIFLHFLCFLLFARLLKINPWVGLLGAIAFSFSSYELIVIQAGHVTKSGAAAFLPALLGAFIYAFRTNRMWGVILSGIFMTFELAMNHVQVTYYFLFILLFLGIYFLVEAIRKKDLKNFGVTAAGIIGVFILAFVINSGNIILTNDYAKYSIRGGNDVTVSPDGLPAKNQSTGLDRDYITQWSYGIDETFTFVSPYVKGGASEQLGNSPFSEQIQNSDLSQAEINNALKGYSYWGTQPITSGPVYIGVIVCMLAFLGLFFLKDKMKWALFAVTVLAIMLSWGKNFMGLTNFFIDHVPAYNKFRAVTIILVLVELTIPVMGVLFLNELIKQRESVIAQKQKVMIVLGSFIAFLIIVKVAGLGDGYTNPMEAKQYAGLNEAYTKQVMQMDPQVAAQEYQLDITNPQQVQQFVNMQVDSQMESYNAVKMARKQIFSSSMTRSILFAFLGAGLFLIFLYSKNEKNANIILVAGLVILTFADLVPVAYNYLGAVDDASGNGYKYWEEAGLTAYPITTTKGDEEIMAAEIAQNPSLAAVVKRGEAKGKQKADELGYEGAAKINVINSYRFHALSMATNYRVLDFSGAFSSSRASYFHKSLGGYHGAKLRNINNLMEFQISQTNNKVLDMLNVKYFLQSSPSGLDTAILNPAALGNAWLVKQVREEATPNDEIRALGNKFKAENRGSGVFLVNRTPMKEATVYGGETLQYLVPGRDTMKVQLASGLTKGQEAMFVMDINGNTNLVPLVTLQADTSRSFTPLVYLKVEDSFDPANEALMLPEFASKLSTRKFSGEGEIKLTSSAPNKLTYDANVKGPQLAVFSEIYYPIGWKAYVNGKEVPVLKTNYLLRGIQLKDGHSKIEFIYELPKYATVNLVARIGSVILLALFGFACYMGWKKKKRTQVAAE